MQLKLAQGPRIFPEKVTVYQLVIRYGISTFMEFKICYCLQFNLSKILHQMYVTSILTITSDIYLCLPSSVYLFSDQHIWYIYDFLRVWPEASTYIILYDFIIRRFDEE
jgi:hypothetical protein